MRRLGLIGGTSWESTQVYYRLLNQGVRERLGGEHSAPLILWSVDFSTLAQLPGQDRWDEVEAVLADAARRLKGAGAEALMICANTMHGVADLDLALKRPPARDWDGPTS